MNEWMNMPSNAHRMVQTNDNGVADGDVVGDPLLLVDYLCFITLAQSKYINWIIAIMICHCRIRNDNNEQ